MNTIVNNVLNLGNPRVCHMAVYNVTIMGVYNQECLPKKKHTPLCDRSFYDKKSKTNGWYLYTITTKNTDCPLHVPDLAKIQDKVSV